MTIITPDPTGFDIIIEVPVIIFTDDLIATVKRNESDSNITVAVRSASRIGRHDFGENRRHIKQFLHALDERIVDNG